METRRPTREAYGELSKAYDFYNRALFGGRLPQCLITLQRTKGSYGFFSGDRWASGRSTADEIALNPSHFSQQGTQAVLSTLVHEMTHLEQHHFGKPGRGRYHNKSWGLLMDRVGLCPSSTGKTGGKRTGDRVTHYIEEGGRFDLATRKLLATGFELSWIDRASGGHSSPVKPAKTREKYSCPSCDLNAWAKPGVSLTCSECKQEMKVAK